MAVDGAIALPGREEAGGVDLVRFAQTLSAASTLGQLRRGFALGFGRLVGVSMCGWDLADPDTGRPSLDAKAHISDAFVVAYNRHAGEVDPVLAAAQETGQAAYNLDLMSAEEWRESAIYRLAYRMHGMRHVVTAPVPSAGRIAGNLHFGTADPEHDFVADDLRMADAIAALLGSTLAGIERWQRVEQDRDRALAALEMMGTPIAVCEPRSTELQLNDGARRLLADVVDADEGLHRLLARSPDQSGFSRRIEVELVSGEHATVHGHTSPVRGRDGGLVSVLELEHESPRVAPGALAPLTPREREVATLVIDGLSDREIASRLILSRHTVSQYVKRIYRKLEVDSRVALTRVLLGPRGADRRR